MNQLRKIFILSSNHDVASEVWNKCEAPSRNVLLWSW